MFLIVSLKGYLNIHFHIFVLKNMNTYRNSKHSLRQNSTFIYVYDYHRFNHLKSILSFAFWSWCIVIVRKKIMSRFKTKILGVRESGLIKIGKCFHCLKKKICLRISHLIKIWIMFSLSFGKVQC
jgi:hypothetical protein